MSWSAILREAVGGTFRLRGRATRSQIAVYWLTAVGIGLVLAIPAMFLDGPLRARIDEVFSVALALPLPALFVRRLHDQDRTGAWLWLALPGTAMALARKVLAETGGQAAVLQLDRYAWPVDWLSTLTTLALVILLVLPGTVGPNRFGPDPRGRE